jgi:carbon storage regulator
MLVLTRKIGEGIAIGDDVKIVIMQIKGKQVRLGIKASPNTTVHREEVYQKIQDENRAASKAPETLLNQAKDMLGPITWGQGQVPIKRHVKVRGNGGDDSDS